jgi:hypothetical protein
MNTIKPSELITEYDKYFSSDGFNTTYKSAVASRKTYFTSEKELWTVFNTGLSLKIA